eukprot:TRINITY_DN7462_c0_g1_i12.p1 TRINITY_DN7462_c0_g1~~TRINITY_DN7462_c0_g1_i12.p1  ORF type:complete len:219 (-),score=39.60 TRINITY_DN7462_c0_g1_i12:319-975(-)
MSLSDIIVLNVGGTRFETTRATLVSQPDSMLAKMFDPDSPLVPAKPKDDAYFLDRDPETFSLILSFLRSGEIFVDSKMVLNKLSHEAKFYQLPGLEAKIQEIQANNESNQPQKPIGFNIEGKIVWIEREAFGKIPFHKIVEAVEGVLDKDGNIIVMPHYQDFNPKNEARMKEYQLCSLQYFLEFASKVRRNSRCRFANDLYGQYHTFANKIRHLKTQY